MNWSEYFVMLISSSKAGLIVGALSVLKILITGIGLPLFGSAFFYSMNYSMGFIAIQLANGKLATKQPAMTASHLAHAIDQTNLNKNSDHQMISELVVHILRSQFIAFVGNIFIALPSAVLFSWIYERLTGSPLVDSKKALYLIAEVDPIYSASLYYAAIAGVFLFFSGLIVGYYDNLCVVGNIPARIKRHPLLRRILPAWVLVRVSNYLDNNLGTLAGNFYLGIFLGCTGTLGIFLGLPLEIRHITFSAANMGLAAYGLNFNLTQQQIVTSTIGVLGIGVVNLIVSFGLSTIMAVESRKMSFSMYKRISKGMLIYILKNPLKLLVPIKSEGARISVEN